MSSINFDVDPLPWTVDELTMTDSRVNVLNANQHVVATMHAYPEMCDTLVPLARLFIAGPDLLAACELALMFLRDAVDMLQFKYEFDAAYEAFLTVQSAIAKATEGPADV